MKIKQFLTITDAAAFLKGDYSSCFSLYSYAVTVKEWIVCGEIEIDVDVDTGKVRDIATAAIDEKLDAARTLVNVLENEKRDLLAIGYDGEVS